ncbi:MAG: ABC transporter permease [Bacteroidota bacterium]|nr:ABC transporter permease [Bacteroidota bacterium]
MKSFIFHVSPYDLAFLGTIFIGLNFTLLLWFTKSTNRTATNILAMAVLTGVLWVAWVLGKDIQLGNYFPCWSWLPLQFSLTLGPLIYFYVLKITRTEYKLCLKHVLHFSPFLLQQGVLVLEIKESIRTGAATYDTLTFQQMSPILNLLAFISVMTYLYWSLRLIERFYQGLKFNNLSDRYRYQLQWLRRLLSGFGLVWLLWIPLIVVDKFYYHLQLNIQAYYPLYLLLAIILIRIAAKHLFRPELGAPGLAYPILKSPTPAVLKQKSTWLKKAMETNMFYQDAELTLSSLAENLGIHPKELSRIVNTALKKNFNDFINEYRVRDAILKMQDPGFDHITLLGIAFGAGFNSKSTFNRIFKQMTGKSPVEYKAELKKERPNHDLRRTPQFTPVILSNQTNLKWDDYKLNRIYMFKIYLKHAWRHITRHKTYSAINVMGLALGICGCLVIYLVATYEFSFDTFHPDKDQIYCVDISSPNPRDGSRFHMNAVPPPMYEAMRNDLPDLEKLASFQPFQPKVKIKDGEKMIRHFDETDAIITQPDYFDILPYTWLSGNKKTALADPMTVVLTQSRAKTYFGDLPPARMIGRTIIYNDSLMVRVTGILQDWNKNSDFNFSDFISFSTIKSSFLKHQFPLDNWAIMTGVQELVKLHAGVKAAQIDAQFPSFIKKYFVQNPNTQAKLQPFTGIHFHSEYGGRGRKADLRVLYILSAVALFILLIAAINFINLSTAQSIQRTKEIGILKVLGSEKSNILLQFLIETFILALMAVAIALIAIKPLLKLFAAYVPTGVQFHFTDYINWIFLAGIAIFTTVLAGFYPARLLTAFKPVSSLKGKISERPDNKGYLRKSLIISQFTISLLFIIGTIAINNQINYIQNKDLGIKTSNIITLPPVFSNHPGKMKVLAQKLKQLAGVEQVITEGPPPVGRSHMADPIRLRGPLDWSMDSYTYPADEHFVPFYNMKIIAGRNLLHSDSAKEYLINETAAKALGFRDPQDAVGKLLLWGNRSKGYPIAGVVADFYQTSFYNQIIPCVILNNPERQISIALKLTSAEFKKGDLPMLLKGIAKEWKNVYPEEPFNYSFLGDSIEKMYESEQQTQWLMRTATLITIFISCMGLFGLAMFTTERRSREISIRKVMGASITHILTTLNKEVVVLIAIAFLISSPIAYLFIQKWLQNFAYHTNISLWIFILAGAGAMLIALVTVSFQTIKSAISNPVEGLRND